MSASNTPSSIARSDLLRLVAALIMRVSAALYSLTDFLYALNMDRKEGVANLWMLCKDHAAVDKLIDEDLANSKALDVVTRLTTEFAIGGAHGA